MVAVIGGDTFDASTGRIRLADADAPERAEEGYDEARDALSSLISGGKVYLQVGELRSYGRLVCVVYVRYNSAYLVNVNKVLPRSPHVRLDDYPNEFDPCAWTELVLYPTFVEEIKRYEIVLSGLIIASLSVLAIFLTRQEKAPVQRRTCYCHKCDIRSPEGSRFCPNCGQELVSLNGCQIAR